MAARAEAGRRRDVMGHWEHLDGGSAKPWGPTEPNHDGAIHPLASVSLPMVGQADRSVDWPPSTEVIAHVKRRV